MERLPLSFYPDLFETDNPDSGFLLTVYSPRFSTGYFPQRNRFTMLVETHSWKPYAQRVQITRNTIVGLAQLASKHGAEWLAKARAADVAACGLGGSQLTLDYKSGWREPSAAGKAALPQVQGDSERIDFRGYAYTRERSAISGAPVTVYDPATPQIWRVPYRSRIEPELIVRAPRLGYFVPAAFAHEIGERLKCHGIIAAPLPKELDADALEQFHATRVSFSTQPFEGRMRAKIAGDWKPANRKLPATSLFVPISQALSRLIVALFEPQGPDSFAAWGFFNSCFERKEQLEPYVAEQIAGQLYASNAELRAAFERKLKDDAAFSGDPGRAPGVFLPASCIVGRGVERLSHLSGIANGRGIPLTPARKGDRESRGEGIGVDRDAGRRRAGDAQPRACASGIVQGSVHFNFEQGGGARALARGSQYCA